MPDDEQPQPPNKNPFIRFKQHVDDRIGTGLWVLTGRQPKLPPMPDPQANNHAAQDVHNSFHILNMNSLNNTAYWTKWAVSSPYSPYNLQRLPQPVPRDLPLDVAADHFGFEDALEDLLATTQGLPMMDLRQQVVYKSAVRNAFKTWKEPPVVWAERVASRGLWTRAVLPVSTEWGQNAEYSQQQLQHPESVDEWLAERKQRAAARQESTKDDMGSSLVAMLNEWMRDATDHLDTNITLNLATMIRQAARDLGKDPDSPDTEDWVREVMQKLDRDFIFNPAGVLRQMEQVAEEVRKDSAEAARELEALYHVERAKILAQEKEGGKKEAEQAEKKEEKEGPWSDNDLFAAIESAIAEADRSFGNFARAITDTAAKSEEANTNESTDSKSSSFSPWSWPPAGWEKAAAQTQDKNERGEQKNEEVIETSGPYGGKTIRSTTQHVDAFGYVHQKIEVKTLDRDGNEVSRESRYSVQPARTERHGNASSEDSRQNVDQERARKPSSGWFWR